MLEKILESSLDCKEIQRVILKEISPEYSLEGLMPSWNSSTLATWCEELTHWKRPWCWERLKAGGEGDDKGWDGWMASLTRWTWVSVSSRSWWWTGRPDVRQSTGSQRVRHDLVTELTDAILLLFRFLSSLIHSSKIWWSLKVILISENFKNNRRGLIRYKLVSVYSEGKEVHN